MKTYLSLSFVLLLGTVTGCRHHDAIVFATSTQLGVRIGVSAQQVPELQVGFNRQEGALVPLYLAEGNDQSSPHHPVIAGLLTQAQTLLDQAAAAATDASWKSTGQNTAKSASAVITASLAYNKNSDGSVASTLLVDIDAKVKVLAANATKPAADGFAVVRAMITTEINKPALLAQFDKDAKYIGELTNGNRKDAYSVIAILDAGGTGKTTTTTGPASETSGKIAQYFATGIAAQELASQGASAVGATAPDMRNVPQTNIMVTTPPPGGQTDQPGKTGITTGK